MGHEDNETISISEFLRYALRHWLSSLLIVLTAVAGAITYTRILPAQYEASAKIIVLGDSKQQGVSRDIALGNYVALLTSNSVLVDVASETGLSVDQLRNNMSPAREKSSEVITVGFTSDQSDRAASVIDSAIGSFQEVVTEMYGVPKDGVNVVSPAIDSGKPTNKDMVTPVLMSAGGGLALALIVTFLRFDSGMRKVNSMEKMTDDEKRRQRKIAKDAEAVRKQKVAVELESLAANKAEAEVRAESARLRMEHINLSKVNTKISEAESKLKVAEAEKRLAEAEAEKSKKLAIAAELELKAIIGKQALREEKRAVRRELQSRRRTEREETMIRAATDIQVAKIRAQKRIEAENAVMVAPTSVAPPPTIHSVAGNLANFGQTVGGIKRPLGETIGR